MSGRGRTAKGKRLEKLAQAWLQASGFAVELCPNQVTWIKDKKTGQTRPISTKRDYFGCWDGVAVDGFERFFFQVTVWEHVAHKRKDIAQCPFTPMPQDRIYGYISGRNRHFRVLRAPDFTWHGECLMGPRQFEEGLRHGTNA